MSAPGHRHPATARRRLRHLPARAVVVGAGVAGLEACLALRALAGDRVQTTLLAPNRYLAYRPAGVRDPLAVHARVREPVALVARAARAELRHDRLAAVDPDARRISTAGGYEIPYDALIVCAGGRPVPVPPGAEPFDEEHVAGCRVLMHRLRTGRVRSLALVAPPAPARVFDLYDLALEAAATVRREHVAAELALVTAEPAPLAVLGARAAALLHGMLAAQAIEVVESAYVRSIADGELELAPRLRRIEAEHVLAAPRLQGPRLGHLPVAGDGFLAVDPHGRVPGLDGVYAAGDCTAFAVRHPSLAAQQADAAAAAVAADAGLDVPAEPFEPVLRGVLPSRRRRYVEAPLTGGQGDATRVSALPPWTSPARFAARFLGPYLASRARRSDLGGVLVGRAGPAAYTDSTRGAAR